MQLSQKDAITIVRNRLGYDLSPAGIFGWDEKERKKTIINANVKFGAQWKPEHNMGKFFLKPENNILCLDIDGHSTTITDDIMTIVIDNKIIELPLGFYSRTTREDKYHIYYDISGTDLQDTQFRIVGLFNLKLDVFTNGPIFEWHSISPYNEIYDRELTKIPQELLYTIMEYIDTKSINTRLSTLVVASHPERANLTKMYLEGKLTTQKLRNKFFRSVFPRDSYKTGKKKFAFDDFSLNYDLINQLAVKLTTTKQLSREDAEKALLKLIKDLGNDPHSAKTQSILHKQILPQLPNHPAIPDWDADEDYPLEEALKLQGILTPLIRYIEDGNIVYCDIDILTMDPIVNNGSTLLRKPAAQALHPELLTQGHDGKIVWNDSHIPIVQTQNNPFAKRLQLDEYSREVYNLYTPSEYIKQAEPNATKPSNVMSRLISSVLGPDYEDLYYHWLAHILFSRSSPMMVMWVAALGNIKGGTGKSVVTLELQSLIVKSAASQIDAKGMMSGWGDMVSGVRLISLEDMEDMKLQDWNLLYSAIKKSKSAAYKKMNMKHGAVKAQRNSVGISGTSNFRPLLSTSDRRFWCIEPAHIHGITEPLSDEDRITVAKLIDSHEYSGIIQDITDYLLYLYIEETDKYETALYIEAPETIYRAKWTLSASTPSKKIVPALAMPDELDAIIKYDHVQNGEIQLEHLLRFLLANHYESTQYTFLPWKWFKYFLPYVISEDYSETPRSKSAMATLLGTDFIPGGHPYIDYNSGWCHNHNLPQEMADWAGTGVKIKLLDTHITKYKAILSGIHLTPSLEVEIA